ncbi:RluA family pseudouridine synthase [Candidatus Saccharibacteria bacterium]|nr:RluA family pseudouridine synthase [Candidatus Saccharibacteria bacterium]
MKFIFGSEENPDETGRLDAVLAEHTVGKFTRSTVAKLIKMGKVKLNGKKEESKATKLKVGDKVELDYEEPKLETEIEIIFEDESIVVINKPPGMLSHAKGKLSEEVSVADWMADKTTDLDNQEQKRSGIVHRLDRATSGVMILAKNPEIKSWLMKQFSDRNVHKKYLAIIEGSPEEVKFKIDMPIGRNPRKLTTFFVTDSGRPSQTEVEVLSTNGKQSLVLLTPKTGRTHQLRVHMWANGWPILGDPFYNPNFKDGQQLMLHALSLTIQVAEGDEKVWRDFEVEAPGYFKGKIKELSLKF